MEKKSIWENFIDKLEYESNVYEEDVKTKSKEEIFDLSYEINYMTEIVDYMTIHYDEMDEKTVKWILNRGEKEGILRFLYKFLLSISGDENRIIDDFISHLVRD